MAWLRSSHEAGATIASACSSALLLAEAGLLAGCDATTHWAFAADLARYPNVKVRTNQSLVVTGVGERIVMAGGGTSWLDMALYLIARYIGLKEARQVARIHMLDWHDGGQLPYASLLVTKQIDDAVILRCQEWVALNYATAAPVAAMMRIVGLPERSFMRRFTVATGMSPLEYVHRLRIEEAKQMLETADEPIEVVAAEVGYQDGSFFSRLFRRRVGMTRHTTGAVSARSAGCWRNDGWQRSTPSKDGGDGKRDTRAGPPRRIDRRQPAAGRTPALQVQDHHPVPQRGRLFPAN